MYFEQKSANLAETNLKALTPGFSDAYVILFLQTVEGM
jgi:hypothetical protein